MLSLALMREVDFVSERHSEELDINDQIDLWKAVGWTDEEIEQELKTLSL